MTGLGWYHGGGSSSAAAWAQAVGVFVAVLVALFQDWIRARFWRAELSVRRTPDRASFHKTRAYHEAPDVVGWDPVYYYRLEVSNDGNAAARDVEVFLRAAFSWTSAETRVPVERFVPEWLCWTTLRHVDPTKAIFLPVLPSGARRYFDLAHVLEPKARRFRVGNEDDPEVGEGQTILSLDVAVQYLRLGHLLPPGRYTLVLEVASANTRPRVFEVDVTNSGWYDKEEDMLAQGVMVTDVRSR